LIHSCLKNVLKKDESDFTASRRFWHRDQRHIRHIDVPGRGVVTRRNRDLGQQSFVGIEQNGTSSVAQFDVTTGATINTNFPGLNSQDAVKLAVGAPAALYSIGNWQCAYDPSTGAAISASLITGLEFPVAAALSGNVLFLANNASNTASSRDFHS
jgi:hypothetical protein